MPEAQSSRTSLLVGTTASMWLVWIVDLVVPGPIGHGIVPRTAYGLSGIVMAPFLHASLQHLLANTVPFVLLGAVILLRGARAFTFVLLASAAISGLGTWLFGAPNTHHIGASGVVFGFFGYLLLRAFYDRRLSSALIAIVVAIVYGATFLTSLIPVHDISWTGHVFGFVGGATAARARKINRAGFLIALLVFSATAHASDADALVKYALKLVNRERSRLNLPALKPDAHVAKYAEARAQELLAGREDGLKPYMRWSFRGQSDRVSENVAGWSVSYTPTEHTLRELVRQSHEAMMAEEPPMHGRRAAILDPYATHVGIGIAWEGGQFRLVENIVRRYVELTQPLPRNATTSETLLVAGRARGQAVFDSITVHHEPMPDASAKTSDGLPSKRKEYLPKLGSAIKRDRNGNVNYERYQYAENRFGEIDVTKDGAFSFAVPFTEGPGIYTIAVWVTVPEYVHPFATTNVSVRVEESEIVNMLPIR